MYLLTACPSPDRVPNSFLSISYNTWLAGDVFTYICNGNLILNGASENVCTEMGNVAFWSLSIVLGNLPVCGKNINSLLSRAVNCKQNVQTTILFIGDTALQTDSSICNLFKDYCTLSTKCIFTPITCSLTCKTKSDQKTIIECIRKIC